MSRKVVIFRILRALLPYAAVGIGMYVFNNAWLSIALYHLGILLFLLPARNRAYPLSRTFKGGDLRIIAGMLALCAMAGPALYFLWQFLCRDGASLGQFLANYKLTGMAWLVCTPYFSVVHPILEELHWRNLAAGMGKRPCWLDVAFAGFHLPVLASLVSWPWLLTACAVLLGVSILWRLAADRYKGLLVPILTHIVADTSVMIAAHVLTARGL